MSLPALRTLETPANDSERYRQYGFWNPKLMITASTAERDYPITFGNETDDQSGTYCVRLSLFSEEKPLKPGVSQVRLTA